MKNSWAFLKRIWPYLSPYKLRVTLVVLFSFFTSGLNLLPIQVMATFVDVVSSSPTKKTSTFWVRYLGTNPINYILAFALIYIASGVILQLFSLLVSTLGLRICEDMRKDAFSWAVASPANTHKTGDVVARIISDTEIASDAVVLPLRGIVVSTLELAWALTLLYTWSPLLSIVAFSIVPILYVLSKWSYIQIKELAKMRQSSLGGLADAVNEAIAGGKTPRNYFAKRRTDQSTLLFFQKSNEEATRSAAGITSFFVKFWPLVRTIIALGLAFTVGIAFKLLQLGTLGPEDIMVAYLYCQRVYDPILEFSRYNVMISSADAALSRVLELRSTRR